MSSGCRVWHDPSNRDHAEQVGVPRFRMQRETPEFGLHTEEMLTEILGYNWDDIANLKNEELI